ncbi:hypothetical protein MXB_1992 [Myxobolus squamalis]|nr:hypothetical protein MXB_1992 [Myxobolus squamalis]
MTEETATFKFNHNKKFVRYYTCDIDVFFKIKIDRFAIPQFIGQIENSEPWYCKSIEQRYYLECAVVADCKDICCRVKSRQKPQNNLICTFNELIIFPIMIKNLPKTAKIEIKAILISPKFGELPLAHTSSYIFNEKSEMNISRQLILEMCLFENFYAPQLNEGNCAELSAIKMA